MFELLILVIPAGCHYPAEEPISAEFVVINPNCKRPIQ